MKAAVLHGPGDVRFEEVPEPVPGPGEIVVRTLATLTCGTDRKVVKRGYHARMLKPPTLFGHEAAGEVVAVGEGVRSVRRGDRVVAANSAPCGACRQCARGRENLCEDLLFWNGTFADAFLVPARVVEKNVLPLGSVTPSDAALTEPLACCLKGIQDAGVRDGDRALIIGAGPIGLMLSRLCALRGAEVTVAARRPESLATATAQGAPRVTAMSSAKSGLALHADEGTAYDVVFDAAGAAETVALAIRSVARGGAISLFAGCPAGTKVEVDVTRIHYDEIRLLGGFHHTPAAFRESFALIASGAVRPADFVSSRKTLAELPEDLIRPAAGELKTLVVMQDGPGGS